MKNFMLAAALFAIGALSGCVAGQPGFVNPFGTNELGVPYSKMPPPGLCRIWYPYRSADHQPPVGDCDYLAARLPSDAKLIRGTDGSGAYGTGNQPSIRDSNLPLRNDAGSGSSLPPSATSPRSAEEEWRSRRNEDLNRRY